MPPQEHRGGSAGPQSPPVFVPKRRKSPRWAGMSEGTQGHPTEQGTLRGEGELEGNPPGWWQISASFVTLSPEAAKATYQQGVHPHVAGPVGVRDAHGGQGAGIGVGAARPHQNGLQLRALLLQPRQRLADGSLHGAQLDPVPAQARGPGAACAEAETPLVPVPGGSPLCAPYLCTVAWMNCSISGKGDTMRM